MLRIFLSKQMRPLSGNFMTMRTGMRLVLILLTFFLVTAESPSPWGVDELVGKKAPDFTLKDLAGGSVSLSSMKGKAVLVNFWATWCPPCRDELPSLSKLSSIYKSKGLVVFAVATDKRTGDVQSFLAKHSFTFQTLADPDLKTSRMFRVFSMPTSFLIDRNGVVVKRYLGEEEWDSPEIRKDIEKALAPAK
ncbi:MAG TPA: TlpA disulfide reductase family protein [Thermodesulfovibrionales bacterium]|nr:TlpA disulfide reductase family protein [Thermodesulfovibrionales bacterium]